MIPHSAELLDIRLDHLFSIDMDIIHKHNKRYGWRLLPTSETFYNPRHDVGPEILCGRPTPQEPPRPTHLPNPSRDFSVRITRERQKSRLTCYGTPEQFNIYP